DLVVVARGCQERPIGMPSESLDASSCMSARPFIDLQMSQLIQELTRLLIEEPHDRWFDRRDRQDMTLGLHRHRGRLDPRIQGFELAGTGEVEPAHALVARSKHHLVPRLSE